ncbi:MAG: hypothetical protein NTV93_16235 [Verrucomicrobia bacterium]|nr:hypothetical protein [Verrucomicrobiota bacterium]
MKFPRLVGVFVFLSISLLRAQQQDVAPPNVDSIIKEIEALELKQKQGKISERNALLGAIQSAAASGPAAANFYTQAVEEVNFKGKKDKVEAFIGWKKSHSDLLRTKEMQTALLLHLKYLLLALQRKELEKPETQLPAVMAYLNELIACDDLFADQKPPNDETRNLLAQPLNQSVFAQWLRLGEWLPDDKTWEGRPGNISGILEKNVRSVMRDTKDPQLIQTWDLEMKVEAARITTGRSDHQADQFNAVNRPRLQFKQAQDMIIVGQPNRALAQMITLVRTSPSHPDFATWVAKIRELVKPASPQTSPSPAPDTAP